MAYAAQACSYITAKAPHAHHIFCRSVVPLMPASFGMVRVSRPGAWQPKKVRSAVA